MKFFSWRGLSAALASAPVLWVYIDLGGFGIDKVHQLAQSHPFLYFGSYVAVAFVVYCVAVVIEESERLRSEITTLQAQMSQLRRAKYAIGDKIVDDKLLWPDVMLGLEYLTAEAERFNPHLIFGILRGGGIVGGFISRRLQKGDAVRNFRTFWLDPNKELHVDVAGILPATERLRVLIVDDAVRTAHHMIMAGKETEKLFAGAIIKTMVLVQTNNKRETGEAHNADCFPFHSNNIALKLPWQDGWK
jgi:hypothetical protein